MSARAAAKHFGISRDSVKKMLSFSVPPGYSRTAVVKRPKLDGFTSVIDQWLIEDQGRNRKQRHTAKRVFERLRDEHGFTGGIRSSRITCANRSAGVARCSCR
jgi:transposase